MNIYGNLEKFVAGEIDDYGTVLLAKEFYDQIGDMLSRAENRMKEDMIATSNDNISYHLPCMLSPDSTIAIHLKIEKRREALLSKDSRDGVLADPVLLEYLVKEGIVSSVHKVSKKELLDAYDKKTLPSVIKEAVVVGENSDFKIKYTTKKNKKEKKKK